MNVNKAIIVGRLTKDPEARTTTSGKSVTSMTVATSSTWNDQSGQKQEKTEFHNVVLWGKIAEIAAQYLIKGQEVYIEGRIETRNWEGKDGVKRYQTEIIIGGLDGRMQMGSKPQGANYQKNNNPPAKKEAKSDSQEKKNDKSDSQDEEIRIEDIPF
ncbi:MAG: single-stranded DNA-binding protein [Patescibacteria group bacterium]|nr:single-stranded DNA-binding protein [Patescibacteria group bacterium]